MPYLLLAPRQPWEPYGQACSLQTVHWLPKGLADYNPRSASPSDVWANDSAYHNPPPKVMAKRATTPSFRSKCIARNQEQQPPSHKREAALALVRHGAFSCVARSGGNVPAWLVFIFQATRRTFLFPVRPIAQEKGRKASCFKKFFQFFSETYHSQVDCLLSEAGFLSNFITVKAGHFQKGNLDGELVLFG